MTTFDDATAQRTVMNLCVDGGMTTIQKENRCKSRIYIRMCINSLCTSCMADLVMGGQTVLVVDDRHVRIKSKLWQSRTSLKAIVGRQCAKYNVAVSAGCSKSTAQCVLKTADLGLSHVSAR